jgi:hypothetical protein
MQTKNIKPNVFFIGSPKCGTTAMARYLDAHPDICVSKPKEPNFFAKEPENAEFASLEEYLRVCFPNQGDHEVWIDANIIHLHIDGAVERILEFNPNARFIILLRNPVDAAFSLYQYQKAKFEENADSFQKAWELQAKRRRSKEMPDIMPEYRELLQYGEMYKYGKRIERLFEKISKDRVKIMKLSNMKKDPEKLYKDVLNFLDLPVVINTEFPVVNEGKKKRSKAYHRHFAVYECSKG